MKHTQLREKIHNGTATPEETAKFWNNVKRNAQRRQRDQAMRDCGLVKVRGNLGGTYWE